jgi:hypothetical protein
MKKLFVVSFLCLMGALMMPRFVVAQESDLATVSADATASGEATSAAKLVVEKVTEKKPDITEPEGEVKGRLEQYLAAQEVRPLGLTNFLQHAIREAVRNGVPANTIVLVLLFPVVAAIIAAGRHLIGLRGFGIFTPAVLSVAFVATGIVTGIALFLIILMVAMLMRRMIHGLKLQYLPRMALLLWGVSLGVFAALFISPFLDLKALVTIQIFPILILILLAENFIEVQIGKSEREATQLTMETIILALISSLVLSLDAVQKFALLNPELLVMGVAVFDIFVGRYVGLRYTEYLKYKKLLK